VDWRTVDRGRDGQLIGPVSAGRVALLQGTFDWQRAARLAGSPRLAKFQRIDVDRLSRGMRWGVSGIRWNMQEISVVD
jgi:hypothetical protein